MARQFAFMMSLITFTVMFWSPIALADETDRFVADGERAKQYIRHLASDELEGRKSATEGYRKAADWVAARFAEWGLDPAGEEGSYFQKVAVREHDWNVGTPALSVSGREFYLDDGDFALISPATPGEVVEAEVVFVGYGICAPEKELDEYEGLTVDGKIVLVLKGSPTNVPEARRMFSRSAPAEEKPAGPDKWKEESKDQAKIKTAYDRGAAAVLLYDPDPDESDGARRYRSSRSSSAPFEPERDFVCFTIEERVFRAIMKGGSQESPRGMTKRIDTIRREIKAGTARSAPTGVGAVVKGYDATIEYSEKQGTATARNVLAKIAGTDPALKDQYVIVGAHLDHLGMRNGYVYNGADDNASGSAVVMEVARVLSEGGFAPRRTVIFCCWCAEELGLQGSYHYTKTPCDDVSMDRVVAYFNMDMVGLGDAIRASGALNFPTIWEVIKRDQDPELMKIVQPRLGGPGGSDHSGFIVKGIEALALMTSGGAGHPNFHQPEDDWDRIDPAILGKTGQFVLQGAMSLANETDADLLIENREQLYLARRMEIRNYNPDLPGSRWKTISLDADGKAGLRDKIFAEALALTAQKPAAESSSGGRSTAGRSGSTTQTQDRSRPARSVTRGLVSLSVFEGDVELLELTSDFHGIGRVDIKGDDGFWIADGRLTEAGRSAVGAMEKKGISLRLLSPSEELINDLLSATAKPFLITGECTFGESTADRLVEKGVFVGIDLDPSQPDDFIGRLEDAKKLLGKRENLIAFLTSVENLDDAKIPLYMGLIAKGWAHKEIYGSRKGRTGIMGGNLRSFEAGQSSRP